MGFVEAAQIGAGLVIGVTAGCAAMCAVIAAGSHIIDYFDPPTPSKRQHSPKTPPD